MFGMSMIELGIILAVALLLFGPDQLPTIAKTLGKGMREIRKASDELRATFEQEFVDLPELPKMVRSPAAAAASFLSKTAASIEGSADKIARENPPPGAGPAPSDAGGAAAVGAADGLAQAANAAASSPGTAGLAPTAPEAIDPGAARALARQQAASAPAFPEDAGAARAAARLAAAEAKDLMGAPVPRRPGPQPGGKV